MTRDLLWRGMLAGVLAALLATLFARVYAEPQVDRAIAFEAAHEARGMGSGDDADAPVSRTTQKGIGLATAVLLYGAAVGGMFSLIFAYSYGRIGRIGPRMLALVIAGLGFTIIALVPALKYPPNPPAIGRAETIQLRTGAYFAMIVLSIGALILGSRVRAAISARLGAFNALIVAAVTYILVVALAQFGLPRVDEVPADFPADVLWNFRLASLGMQLVLWTALGLSFGWLADKRLRKANGNH